MASTPMVTRCPQCKTSFRITPAQLQSARGAVRCGSCLHIFKARDHLVGVPSPPQSDSALVRKPNPRPQSKANQSESQAPAQSTSKTAQSPSKTAQSTSTTKSAAQTQPSSDSAKASARRTAGSQRPESQAEPQRPTEPEGDDEDNLLISDQMGAPDQEEDTDYSFNISDSLSQSLFERKERAQSSFDKEPVEEADESWAQNLLEEEDEDTDIQLKPSQARDQDAEEREWAASFELVEEPEPVEPGRGDQEISREPDAPEEAGDNHFGDELLHATPEDRTQLLHQIHPEPVNMGWLPQKRNRAKWLWGGLSLLALLTLVGQLAWWQFDRLARVEPYRWVYGQACQFLGCELPALTDPSRIRAYNLVVRDHPDTSDALMIDAILLNTASFAQPFPELVLEFSDLDDQLVAKRSFEPGEYLSGEMAGREQMPPNQPVHLTLELVDPGEEAVNYRAYIPN